MTTKFLLLASAAAFGFAACSSDNKTETATTSETTLATPPAAVDTLSYRAPADQLASQVASDIQVTDTATVHKIKQVYYNRGRILGKIIAAPDSAGRYAATKAANDEATRTIKTIVSGPQYTTYATRQSGYYNGGPYTVVTSTTVPTKSTLAERVGQGSGVKKMENDDDSHKVKFENGAKIKRSDDGSLKIKRADGTKVKIDANGHRTVK